MRNNFPDLITPLSTNAKRRFLKSAGLRRPAGLSLTEIHAAGIESEAAQTLFETSIHKLLKALHWKHTGNIVRRPEGIKSNWYTNAYFHVLEQQDEQKFFAGLPACPPMRRGNRDLSDQFFYRYGKDDPGELSAFAMVFRNSVVATGIVAQSDELIAQMSAMEAERPG